MRSHARSRRAARSHGRYCAASGHPVDTWNTGCDAPGMSRTLLLLLAVGLSCVRCAPPPDPVTANRVLGPGDELATRTLTPADEAALVAAMRDGAKVADPIRPTPAPHGVRWSDVPTAVLWAADECDMAILRRERTETGYRFELVTMRDEPAELIVDRIDPPTIATARASVGSLGRRVDDARRLEASFRRFLLAFGEKPGYGE